MHASMPIMHGMANLSMHVIDSTLAFGYIKMNRTFKKSDDNTQKLQYFELLFFFFSLQIQVDINRHAKNEFFFFFSFRYLRNHLEKIEAKKA